MLRDEKLTLDESWAVIEATGQDVVMTQPRLVLRLNLACRMVKKDPNLQCRPLAEALFELGLGPDPNGSGKNAWCVARKGAGKLIKKAMKIVHDKDVVNLGKREYAPTATGRAMSEIHRQAELGFASHRFKVMGAVGDLPAKEQRSIMSDIQDYLESKD